MKLRPLKILFSSAEVAPFSKIGGLGDVAGSLPMALGRLGHTVLVVTPQYQGIRSKHKSLGRNVQIRFLQNDKYFKRQGIYGRLGKDYADNLERFAYLSKQTLELARKENFKADIIHLHDWHTALVPIYLKTRFLHHHFFRNMKTVLTIHNLAYQGMFELKRFARLGLPRAVSDSFHNRIWGKANLLKGGVVSADFVTTVSKTYAREIQRAPYGCGLEHVMYSRRKRLYGILNGIDTDAWNPATDTCLARGFSSKQFQGRLVNREALLRNLKLPLTDEPVFGVVARLVEQKGFDLIMQSFERLMRMPLKLVILGDGERTYKLFFQAMQKKYSSRFAFRSGFQERLARLIYGGSDFFLMPSRFEPCGLGQLISFRYGAVPVVHKTGGLSDTVREGLKRSHGAGVVFGTYKASSFLEAIRRATRLFKSKRYGVFQKHNLSLDYSWDASAKIYEGLYREALAS